jgi:transposase
MCRQRDNITPYFPSFYEDYKVKCSEQLKAPPGAQTPGETDQLNAVGRDKPTDLHCSQPPEREARYAMDSRQLKALEIAATSNITQSGDSWLVPSQRSGKSYTVHLTPEPNCTCADYETRRRACKHVYAVLHFIQHEKLGTAIPNPSESEPIKKPTYRQEWSAYNQAQTKEKAIFQSMLYELCRDIDEPPQIMGRPRVLLADLIFCAGLKIYTGFSGRRNMSDLRIAQQRGYISNAVHYNTISKYLERKLLTSYLLELITQSSLPLRNLEEKFAVDSTGLSTGRFVRWFDVKYGNTEDWRDWIKLHLVCGVKTNVVTAVKISGRSDNDSPFFKPLLEATSDAGWNIREVSADKEYLSDKNLRLVLLKGGEPYIPFKSNSTSKKKSTTWTRMLNFYRFHEDEFNAHYHQRSNVESTFAMIKAKFGEKLRSKTETSQVNEALLKVLCHNFCCVIQSIYEFGIDPTFTNLEMKTKVDHKV